MSNLNSRLVAVSFALVLFAILVIPGVAQIDIGSLDGVVTDAGGKGVVTVLRNTKPLHPDKVLAKP